jgi:maltooligosyltrehalose trehalohydrolase
LNRNDRAAVFELEPESGGYFSGLLAGATAGSRYRFDLESGTYPDPASRFQPEGPHGPSEVVDPASFSWTDEDWRGVPPEGQVIYEMHAGTFTREGTWDAASEQLGKLAELGITVIELMPIADFVGRFGWGYDGVDLFAPTRLYGRPDDLRRFVDRAHHLGVGVILDVVYNHFGPDGNYMSKFSEDYFTNRHKNEWGAAINFDGPESGPVREFFVSNAGYWIDEFHLDGLRLDATQQIFDSSEEHILASIAAQVRQSACGRATFLVAENESQHARLVRPSEEGGCSLDALWNDDFHHTAMVLLTGRSEAYYTDYKGTPQEFISAMKWGYLFQGQRYKWQKNRRGTPALDLDPWRFVNYIQNHDQVANSLQGVRAAQLTSPGQYRALTALLLLGSGTPLLFQGQEFASSSPFLYFADHNPKLAELVAKGRREFLSQFRTIACAESETLLANPQCIKTFERCKLDFIERETHAAAYVLHRDLIKLRRTDPVFRRPRRGGVDGAVLSPEAFVLRYFDAPDRDRLLLVNFGRDLHLDPAPEPLLAPVASHVWKVHWSTEDPNYGGCGTPPVEGEENWQIPGHAAVVLVPAPAAEMNHGPDHPQN